jgi:hypothetical protein
MDGSFWNFVRLDIRNFSELQDDPCLLDYAWSSIIFLFNRPSVTGWLGEKKLAGIFQDFTERKVPVSLFEALSSVWDSFSARIHVGHRVNRHEFRCSNKDVF